MTVLDQHRAVRPDQVIGLGDREAGAHGDRVGASLPPVDLGIRGCRIGEQAPHRGAHLDPEDPLDHPVGDPERLLDPCPNVLGHVADSAPARRPVARWSASRAPLQPPTSRASSSQGEGGGGAARGRTAAATDRVRRPPRRVHRRTNAERQASMTANEAAVSAPRTPRTAWAYGTNAPTMSGSRARSSAEPRTSSSRSVPKAPARLSRTQPQRVGRRIAGDDSAERRPGARPGTNRAAPGVRQGSGANSSTISISSPRPVGTGGRLGEWIDRQQSWSHEPLEVGVVVAAAAAGTRGRRSDVDRTCVCFHGRRLGLGTDSPLCPRAARPASRLTTGCW